MPEGSMEDIQRPHRNRLRLKGMVTEESDGILSCEWKGQELLQCSHRRGLLEATKAIEHVN
jgi:hypothetical protein